MLSIKTNALNVKSDIEKYLIDNDKLIGRFNVIPLDHTFENIFSSQIFLSTKKLFFYRDEILEIYELDKIEIHSSDIQPQFDIQSHLLEGNFRVNGYDRNVLSDISSSQTLFKFSIQEGTEIPKDFVYRFDTKVGKNFQNWALFTILKNAKNQGTYSTVLSDMLENNFSTYQPQFLLKVVIYVLIFVAIKIALSYFKFGMWEYIADILFLVVMGFTGYRMITMYNARLKQYQRVYLSYK